MPKIKMPTYEELQDALSDCLDDLNNWATSNPEGFTRNEAKRATRYQRILERASLAVREARTPETALTAIGAWQDANGRWCHKKYDDQWRGEEPADYLQRLREIKAGLSL